MKIVLEIVRCLGRFSHQRMRLKIRTMIPSEMARNWRAVRPSGPSETAREGLATRISSSLIGLAMESWTGALRHGDGCRLYEYCFPVRLHRGSRWLFGILDVSQGVLDTSHAVGAPVSLGRGVFSASGLPAHLLLLVGCHRWLVVVRARRKDVPQVTG